MKSPSSSALSIGLPLALVTFAFVAAPHSCEWGLSAYFATGLVAISAGFGGPFLLKPHETGRKPLLQAALNAMYCAIAWLVGLFAADFQLLCRLF